MTERYIPMFTEERNSDTVKRIKISKKNILFFVSLIEHKIELFDIYTGTPIPAGKKSAAFSLAFRADDRTLTDQEADAAVQSALALLERELGAVLR